MKDTQIKLSLSSLSRILASSATQIGRLESSVTLSGRVSPPKRLSLSGPRSPRGLMLTMETGELRTVLGAPGFSTSLQGGQKFSKYDR